MFPPPRVTMLRRAMFAAFAACCALGAFAQSAQAAQVTNLEVVHRSGQTFITWDNLPGTGWTYRIYAADQDFGEEALVPGSNIGRCGDSSGVDIRISRLIGQVSTYRIADDAAPLAPGRGLFVATPPRLAGRWYAVTAQLGNGREDLAITIGQNATAEPVGEHPERPRPVWQRTLQSPPGEDYVLWGSNEETEATPALTSVPSRAFHFGVIRGQAGAPLILQGHGRGGSFFNSLHGFGILGESVISVDDWLASGDYSTWYFGHHTVYNPDQPTLRIPYSGRVADYTDRRVLLVLDWARSELGYDDKRVYASGASMGGTFAVMLAWHHPERIAAAIAGVPMLTFNYLPDAAPQMRPSMDRMWGPLDFDLDCTNGYPVYSWIDGRWLAETFEWRGSSPIVSFHGRTDDIIGWPSTAAYLNVAAEHRAGGIHFWDGTGHATWSQGPWRPMQNGLELTRYRLDSSWPSFANCSTDQLTGDGTAASGDSVGQINGYVDYDPAIVDEPGLWSVVLKTRALAQSSGALAAPGELTADVTPRRLQRFRYNPDSPIQWTVTRHVDGVVLQSGTLSPDPLGVITIPQVRIDQGGSELRLTIATIADAPPSAPTGPRLALALSSNPVRGLANIRLSGVRPGPLRVDLLDVTGRRVRNLHDENANVEVSLPLRTTGLAPGLYWLRASQAGVVATSRVVVLR